MNQADKDTYIAKHNLAVSLKKSYLDNDIEALKEAAQKAFDSGYEIEDLKILPSIKGLIMNALYVSGWTPKVLLDHEH